MWDEGWDDPCIGWGFLVRDGLGWEVRCCRMWAKVRGMWKFLQVIEVGVTCRNGGGMIFGDFMHGGINDIIGGVYEDINICRHPWFNYPCAERWEELRLEGANNSGPTRG